MHKQFNMVIVAIIVTDVSLNMNATYLMGDTYEVDIPTRFMGIVQEFNIRRVTPENINQIIDFCEWLQVINITAFISAVAEPTSTDAPYILDAWNRRQYPMLDAALSKCDTYDTSISRAHGLVKCENQIHACSD